VLVSSDTTKASY